MVRPKRPLGGILHQRLIRRDARVPHFARNSLRHSLGEQQCRRSVQQSRQCQRQSRVLLLRSAQSVRQALLQLIKRRSRLRFCQAHRPIRMDQFVLIAMSKRELEIPRAKLFGGMRPPHVRKHNLLRPLAQQLENVPLIAKSLVHGRRGSPRGPRHRAHGQRPFSALAPQLISSIQNAAFQTSIGCSRHLLSSSLRLGLGHSGKIIFTMYNKRCIRNIGAQYTLFLFPGAVKIRSALRGTMHRFEYVVSTKATPALTWEVYTNWKMWHTFANIYGRMHWQHGEPWSIGSRMEIEILKPTKVGVDPFLVNGA